MECIHRQSLRLFAINSGTSSAKVSSITPGRAHSELGEELFVIRYELSSTPRYVYDNAAGQIYEHLRGCCAPDKLRLSLRDPLSKLWSSRRAGVAAVLVRRDRLLRSHDHRGVESLWTSRSQRNRT